MDLRARDGCVPRTFGERLELVVDVAAERLVVLGLRGFVHLGERLLEFVERDIEVLGKGFERVVLADDVRFDELLHDARTCGFELVGAILVGDGDGLEALGFFSEDGVGADLAVCKLVDETLALRVDPQAVFSRSGLRERPADAHALFLRVGPRTALDPVVLDLGAADVVGFTPEFARGARLVRRAELVRELRVVHLAELDVGREAAVAENDALPGGDELHLAGVFLREAIAFSDFETDHAALVVADDVFDVGTQADFNAEFLALVEFLAHDARTGAVLREDIARNGVAAFLTDRVEVVFDAEFLHRPFIVGEGMFGEDANLRGVVEVGAGNEDVLSEQVDGVLDAVLELLRAARGGQNAAIDDGVAARGRHLLENDDLGARLAGFNGGGKTGKAGADDDHVDGFIPLGGNLRARGGLNDGSGGKRGGADDGALQEGTTGLVGHDVLLLILVKERMHRGQPAHRLRISLRRLVPKQKRIFIRA